MSRSSRDDRFLEAIEITKRIFNGPLGGGGGGATISESDPEKEKARAKMAKNIEDYASSITDKIKEILNIVILGEYDGKCMIHTYYQKTSTITLQKKNSIKPVKGFEVLKVIGGKDIIREVEYTDASFITDNYQLETTTKNGITSDLRLIFNKKFIIILIFVILTYYEDLEDLLIKKYKDFCNIERLIEEVRAILP